jgi:hypothetical protein
LHERYNISDTLFGGLLVYAALTTMLPALLLKKSVILDVYSAHFESPLNQPKG